MPKTYNTISTFTSGQVLTAAQMNEIGTNVNNYRVPPLVRIRKNANQNVSVQPVMSNVPVFTVTAEVLSA